MRAGRTALALGLLLAAIGTTPAVSAASTTGAAAPCNTAAPGGDWPSYGHDAANTRTQPDGDGLGPAAAGGLTPGLDVLDQLDRRRDAGSTRRRSSHDGCVFIGSSAASRTRSTRRPGMSSGSASSTRPNPGSGGVIVGAAAVDGSAVVFLVDEFAAPYAIALDRSTGAVVWKSAPFAPPLTSTSRRPAPTRTPARSSRTASSSPATRPPEGQADADGGFSLIDATTGKVVKTTPTIPPAAQAERLLGRRAVEHAAYDPATKYVYWGAGNPNSKTKQYQTTDAILKIDVDPSRADVRPDRRLLQGQRRPVHEGAAAAQPVAGV